ncbi:hypothetical protein P8452_66738 [Trifolium repens]|nr:hypothetical protein P8452_66738 [Trifolium repens]
MLDYEYVVYYVLYLAKRLLFCGFETIRAFGSLGLQQVNDLLEKHCDLMSEFNDFLDRCENIVVVMSHSNDDVELVCKYIDFRATSY